MSLSSKPRSSMCITTVKQDTPTRNYCSINHNFSHSASFIFVRGFFTFAIRVRQKYEEKLHGKDCAQTVVPATRLHLPGFQLSLKAEQGSNRAQALFM